MTPDDLNKEYGIDSIVQFVDGKGGLPVVEVANQHCTARISLQGAHLTSWKPEAEEDLIWLSRDARFRVGKSIRGGIPVCWPWFGAHETNAEFPAHGHARTVMWDVVATADTEECTHLQFKLIENEWTRQLWPHASELILTFRLGNTLQVILETHNQGEQPITVSQALHTYFNVFDVRHIKVLGLDNCDYLDKLDDFARKRQQGEVTITAETDRIYLQTPAQYSIHDPGLKRRIEILTQGSHSTVVWNPWQQTAEKMGDLGEQGYLHMVCVETANAAEDAVKIQPGETHTISAQYKILSDQT